MVRVRYVRYLYSSVRKLVSILRAAHRPLEPLFAASMAVCRYIEVPLSDSSASEAIVAKLGGTPKTSRDQHADDTVKQELVGHADRSTACRTLACVRAMDAEELSSWP